MSNEYKNDVAKSIKDITQSITDIENCTVLKLPTFLYICCCIQMIATIILGIIVGTLDIVYHIYNQETLTIDMVYIISVGMITLCLFIIVEYISLIRIQKISRYIVLTASYEKAIHEINKGFDNTSEKMKHTAAVYQHYCQSLTKK